MGAIYRHTYRKRIAEGRIGCLYVPAFEAWALARVSDEPGPVVVLSGGGAVSWSRVAALREVRPGDRADRIARLCPDARIRVRDASVEWACWDGVVDALHRITPFIAPSRPPWAWFRVDAIDPLPALAAELGIRIGVADDRVTARLAAVRSADRHVLRVVPERRRAFLDRFDVGLLAEIGLPEEMSARLRLFGYPTLGSLSDLTRRHLRSQFGADGEAVHDLVHPGVDPAMPLHVPPPAVEVAEEPDDPVRDAELSAVAALLAVRASEKLGERRTQRIVLEVHPDGGVPRRVSRLLPDPHNRADTLRRFVLRLLPEVVRPDEAMGRVALRLEALRRPDVSQVDLFSVRPAVLGAVRRVHRRYPGGIRRAVLRLHALLPEDEVILEAFDEEGPKAA